MNGLCLGWDTLPSVETGMEDTPDQEVAERRTVFKDSSSVYAPAA